MAGVAGILFEEAGRLDKDAMLAGLVMVARRVLVGDRHRQPVEQFLDGRIDRGGVAELGEDQQPHRAERRVAENGPVDCGEHVIDLAGNVLTAARVGPVGLARGRIIAEVVRHECGPSTLSRSVANATTGTNAASERIAGRLPRHP